MRVTFSWIARPLRSVHDWVRSGAWAWLGRQLRSVLAWVRPENSMNRYDLIEARRSPASRTRSGSFLGALWLIAIPLFFAAGCSNDGAETDTSGPTPPTSSGASGLRFTDAASDYGLDFQFSHGGTGRRLFIEISAGGVGIFDFDDDGWPDIYCVNGAPTPGYTGPPLRNALFRNRGDGSFDDVTQAAGVGDEGYGCGLAVGDVDGDGDLDLFVTNFGPDVLYLNDGDGSFTRADNRGVSEADLWSSSATFLDFDRDGDLDLYVCHYVEYDVNDPPRCLSPQGKADYCNPADFSGVADTLYRNDGTGRFEDVTAAAGVHDPAGRGFGVVAGDFDDDGDADLYVANDQCRNNLFRNDGDGTFTDIGLYCGLGYGVDGRAEAGMGADFGDFDGDGHLDAVVTNFANETNSLHRNLGQGLFADESLVRGLGEATAGPLAFGGGFLDADNDTDLDLYFACGHVLADIELTGQGHTFAQPDLLLENRDGRFVDVSRNAGTAFEQRRVGRAAAFGDLDLDGDLDIAVSHFDGPLAIYRNDTQPSGRSVLLDLRGVPSNTTALGARLRIRIGERTLVREIRSGASFQSAHDPVHHVGLGSAGQIDVLEIDWPSGRTERIEALPADQVHRIEEGRGRVTSRPLAR